MLESTQKPGGKPEDSGGGGGAGGGGGGGGGGGAGGAGGDAGGAGGGAGGVGVGVGVVEGGVLVATLANGSMAPRPQPKRKIPGTSNTEVTALARMFIRVSSTG